MLDIINNEYFDLELPNMKVEWRKDRQQKTTNYETDWRLREFITTLASALPNWTFLSNGLSLNSEGTTYSVYRFKVYDNRELLGDIEYETNRGRETVYCIHNHRISAQRERGTQAKTKDIKKAVKIVKKSFGVKTIPERMFAAMEGSSNVMYAAYTTKNSDFRNGFYPMIQKMTDHLMQNWEQTSSVAAQVGVKQDVIDALPEQYQEHLITEEIWSAYNGDRGIVVYISGKDYAIMDREKAKNQNDSEPLVQILGGEEIPEWMRRNIGLLKLVEPKHYLRDVGFRMTEDAFFLLNKQEQTNE